MQHEQVGDHPIWQIPLLGTVHSDTILTTWIVMVLSLVFFAWLGASYRKGATKVSKLQSTFEGIVGYLGDLSISTIGRQGEPFVPIFIALFVFIFLLNQVGFLPLKQLGFPFGGSPTADLNTTVCLALIVFFGIWTIAIRRSGIKAFGHLFKPFVPLVILNVIEEIARPVTLSLRLFFNIFVGELLLFVVATIIGGGVKLGFLDISLAATIVPFLLQFFNFFIGTLQAFVFTLLTIVYMSLATAEDH